MKIICFFKGHKYIPQSVSPSSQQIRYSKCSRCNKRIRQKLEVLFDTKKEGLNYVYL